MKVKYYLGEFLNKSIDDLESNILFTQLFSIQNIEKNDQRFYLEETQKGIDLVFSEEKKLISIQLHSCLDGNDEYKSYVGLLPFELRFNMPKKTIREKLGKPDQFSEGKTIPILGYYSSWDKYDDDNMSIHFQYTHDELGVSRLTLSPCS